MTRETLEQSPVEQPSKLVDQRFRLMETLGSGPVHRAYRAYDESARKEVCLKIPRPKFQGNDGFASRYRRDLLDVMNLADSNWIVPDLIVEQDGVPVQVLPLAKGVPLTEWFDAHRDEQRLLVVLNRAIKALERLQRVADRLHGTIKPSNLLVTAEDEPLFLDLAATGRLEDHFAEKARSGKPVYCSPEQLLGERADTGSDLYCLGLVVYEALSGRHPFFGGTESEPSASPERLLMSLVEQLQSRPTPPSHFLEDVPRWADRFLSRCLSPNPNERFSTHHEALSWLKNHTKQEQSVSAEQRALPPAGREQAMRYLEEQLEKVVRGGEGGQIVRLHGDPGCGKTRCLDWLVDLARSKKAKVVLVDPTPESGLHLQSVLAELGQEFPERVSGTLPVVETLLGVAVEQPLLLVVRDIPQADDTLVEFLREVESVLTEVSLLVILVDDESTYRSAQMAGLVQGFPEHLRLEPLDRRAVANLIEEKSWTPPDAAVTSWVHKVSEGNALHAVLLVEYLLQNSYLSDAMELSWRSSPPTERPSLQEAIIWKLGCLSYLARTVLETAAVLGQTFRLATLNAINYRNDEEVDEALGEGVSRGILEVQGTRVASYRWKHPKFRAALLRDIHPRRKQRIHRLAAAYYSRGRSDPSRMAYHFLEAGDAPELFYWGSKAVEQALTEGRRGDGNYWMNVMLTRIPEHEWLGPDIEKARLEVGRDQADSLDLKLWAQWLRALSGRPPGAGDSAEPLLRAQRALSSNLSWEEWKPEVESVAAELRKLEESLEVVEALEYLDLEWATRCGEREPFPSGQD